MPYAIVGSGKNWKVINKDTGRVLGKHPSKADAVQQLRAVYANTKGR